MPFQRFLLGSVTSAVLLVEALCGWAQESAVQPAGLAAQGSGEPLSLKERLSDKASDEQRVNNCKVPLERRGAKKRPGCEDDHPVAPTQ